MDNMNASKHLVLASAAVVFVAAIGVFWLVSGKKPSQADTGATTETTAVSAGAKVTPTEPKPRIEPK
jgi:hypothetical protein